MKAFNVSDALKLSAICTSLLAAIYLGSMIKLNGEIMVFWPVGGLSVYWVWRLGIGKMILPLVFAGIGSAWIESLDTMMTVQRILSTVVTGWVGGQLLTYFSVSRGLQTLRDIGVFLLAATLLPAGISSATGGAATTLLTGSINSGSAVWWACWLAETLGILLVLPVLVYRPQRPTWASGLIALIIVTISAVVYLDWLPMSISMTLPLSFLTTPFFLLAAFRMHRADIAWLLLIHALIAMYATSHTMGPFTLSSVNESLLGVMGHLILLSTSIWLIKASLDEHKLAHNQLKMIANHQSEILIYTDLNGQVIFASDNSQRWIDDIKQEGFNLANWITSLTGHNPLNGEDRRFSTKVGDHWLQWRKADDETKTGWVWTAHDISAEVAAKAEAAQHLDQVARLGRLSDLAQLAGGIAHELNQPLTAITSFSQALKRFSAQSPAPTEKIDATIDRILQSAERASNIVRDTRGFLGEASPAFEPVDISALIPKTLELFDLKHRYDQTAISLDIAKTLVVHASRSKLQQILVNLIKNALEAMDNQPGSTLSIIGYSRQHDVLIEISDNGPGIDDQLRESLFAPFSSTQKQGIGLGLNISMSLAESMSGQLALSHPRSPTTFTLCLNGVSQ